MQPNKPELTPEAEEAIESVNLDKVLAQESQATINRALAKQSKLNNIVGDTIIDSASVKKALLADKTKEEEASKGIDLSVLKGAKRLPDEDFDKYRARLKREKKILEKYLRGRRTWNSLMDGQYRRPKEKASA
jgi:hypothetical protein